MGWHMILANKILHGVMTVALVVVSTNAMAKVSDDDKLFRQVEKIDTAIKTCVFEPAPLEEIKNKSIATSVTSGVAGAANVTSVVASATAISNDKKLRTLKDKSGGESAIYATNKEVKKVAAVETNTDNQSGLQYSGSITQKAKNARMVSAVAAGVATGASAASFVMSLTSWNKLGELMNSADDCVRALDDINLNVPTRTTSTRRY